MASFNSSALLEVEDVGAVTVVRFLRRDLLEEDVVQRLGEQLTGLVDEEGCRWVVVNLSRLEYISGSTIGKLVLLYKKTRQAGGRMALCQLQPRIHEIFTLIRLDLLFVLHDSEQDALRALQSAVAAETASGSTPARAP